MFILGSPGHPHARPCHRIHPLLPEIVFAFASMSNTILCDLSNLLMGDQHSSVTTVAGSVLDGADGAEGTRLHPPDPINHLCSLTR